MGPKWAKMVFLPFSKYFVISFSVFQKTPPPISLSYDPSLIKNFYKAGRYSSVFFRLTPLPLISEEYE